MRGVLIFSVLALAGCGPSVEFDGSDAGTTGGSPSTSTGSHTGTSMGPGTRTTTSTSTDGGVDSSDTYGEVDGGATFTVSYDMGVTGGPCSVIRQSCPPGYKCAAIPRESGGWSGMYCFPLVRDPAGLGDPCTLLDSDGPPDDCGVGLMCWMVDDSGVGYCEDTCIGSDDALQCPDPEETCVLGYSSVPLCVPPCDPVLQDCPSGQGCYPGSPAWGCYLDDPVYNGVHGDVCSTDGEVNRCDPGHACLPAWELVACGAQGGGQGCCTTVCELGNPDSDALCAALDPGHVCSPWYDGPAPFGQGHVGVCRLPG